MIRFTQKPSTENIDIRAVDFSQSYDHASALVGEEFAYQIVLCSDSGKSELLTMKSRSSLTLSFYLARPEAVCWPFYQDADPSNYFLRESGVACDRLIPLKNGDQIAVGTVPIVLWVGVKVSYGGVADCRVQFSSADEEFESSFQLEAIHCDPLTNRFRYCEHIYPSAIAKAHNIPLFSDEYWEMLKRYFKLAADHGVTDVLVPAFPTVYPYVSVFDPVQLITVTKEGAEYKFNFDLMDTWMYFAFKSGIRNMVFPPLYPALAEKRSLPWMQTKYKSQIRLFSEEIACDSFEYFVFLRALLRKLNNHLAELDPKFTFTFQITDGVDAANVEDYRELRKKLSFLGGDRIMDPVADRAILDRKLLGVSLLPLAEFDAFSDASLIHSSIYMDPATISAYADLLVAGKSERLRRLGVFFFEHQMHSLYNRGFNYDDAFGMYPDGALSLIYTEADGPLASVRLKQLCFVQQDVRALLLLQHHTSRQRVLTLIRKSKNLLELREAVNRLLAEINK